MQSAPSELKALAEQDGSHNQKVESDDKPEGRLEKQRGKAKHGPFFKYPESGKQDGQDSGKEEELGLSERAQQSAQNPIFTESRKIVGHIRALSHPPLEFEFF